jgi:hypothetical protein
LIGLDTQSVAVEVRAPVAFALRICRRLTQSGNCKNAIRDFNRWQSLTLQELKTAKGNHLMSDEATNVDVRALPMSESRAVAAEQLPAMPAPESNGSPTPMGQAKASPQTEEASAPRPTASGENASYQNFNAGDKDPLVGVTIKEVLIKADAYFVYIDQDLVLRWHWNSGTDPNVAAPIFNRASELLAKSEFLRQARRTRDLTSARRLIGEGLVIMFSTRNQTYANAALDTAEKFITQIGTETSRGWYFGPFFVFFALSVLGGLILYRHGHMGIATLPLVCCLAGGIGAFISTAIGNERIPCAPTAGLLLHLLEALLRYTIGFAAGLLVWLATSGNIVVGFLNLSNNSAGASPNPWPGNSLPASIYALVAVTMLAGASERLLPSLIAKFDDSTKGSDGGPGTSTPDPEAADKAAASKK